MDDADDEYSGKKTIVQLLYIQTHRPSFSLLNWLDSFVSPHFGA
jgi:hypothetical protein